jgi:hypothetical protein
MLKPAGNTVFLFQGIKLPDFKDTNAKDSTRRDIVIKATHFMRLLRVNMIDGG